MNENERKTLQEFIDLLPDFLFEEYRKAINKRTSSSKKNSFIDDNVIHMNNYISKKSKLEFLNMDEQW